jgi:hypothetical protein
MMDVRWGGDEVAFCFWSVMRQVSFLDRYHRLQYVVVIGRRVRMNNTVHVPALLNFLGNHCRMSELSNYERRMFDCLKFKNDSLFKLDKNKYSCISVETRLTFNDQADSVHTCTRRPQNRSFFSRADHTIDFFKARDSTILIMLLALHPIIHKDKEWRLSLLQYLFNNFYTCT